MTHNTLLAVLCVKWYKDIPTIHAKFIMKTVRVVVNIYAKGMKLIWIE